MPLRSTERRRQISSLTAVKGRVTVIELAEKFGVTAETIRRDLATLDAQGGIRRVHGGAVPSRNYRTEFTPFESRAQSALDAKRRIARKALELLPPPGSTLFLDGGTTTALMAEALATSGLESIPHAPTSGYVPPYKLITNSLPIAKTLADSEYFDIQLLGGKVRPQAQAVVGNIATQTIAVLRADVAFVGTNALTLNHGLSTPDEEEGAVKRAMVTHAEHVIALVDATKFGLDYLVSFAAIEDISTVVTDLQPHEAYVAALENAGISVAFAEK